ncbi:MAG: methyltransferase domain-containing protein [Thermodesulfobacteriota bacterium]|nr:methyltransferase domain-containing protein [Thermodesulfobacteriota bacterium]
MWTAETSNGYEVRKVRDRITPYLDGIILDIGCGSEKVCREAIGVDLMSKAANINLDLSDPHSLKLFGDQSADVVFSAHFLEHIRDFSGALREFWRILKVDGVLILYLPHKNFYPKIGEFGANPDHKHDFEAEDILSVIREFNEIFTIERNEIRAEADEYSFELIIRKGGVAREYAPRDRNNAVIVVRYGGFGDMVIAAPIFRMLKEQGHYVIANCSSESVFVLEGNPYIDEFIIQTRYTIPLTQLSEYFDSLSKQYNARIINLCESMERSLLIIKESDPDLWNLSHEERHKRCNVNYSEAALAKAGFTVGARPELYLTKSEEVLARFFREQHEGYFKLMWQASGSSWHKLPPFTSDVIDELLETYPDMKAFLTGGSNVAMVDWNHPRLLSRIDKWNPRQSMALTKYMDCVVSPETGILNAAGAFNTPKIGMLTHSSKENLTKYFVNDYSVESSAPCAPCHKMIYELEDCPRDSELGLPVCMSSRYMDIGKIKDNIKTIYNKWKEKQNERD